MHFEEKELAADAWEGFTNVYETCKNTRMTDSLSQRTRNHGEETKEGLAANAASNETSLLLRDACKSEGKDSSMETLCVPLIKTLLLCMYTY